MERPTATTEEGKLKLAVYKFSSCDGCQLSILNLEEKLLELADTVEIAYFLEARRREVPPPYAIGLVEGSISTPEEEERIRKARRDCRTLVAIGACATAGGIQALRNWAETGEFSRMVYAHPEYIKTLDTATPVAAHVFVDFELRGCPPNGFQVLEVVTAMLAGRKPVIPTHSLCISCKRRGIPCLLVSQGKPCMGPITMDGCGVLCPSYDRPCYGCFGPMELPNIASLGQWFESLGYTPEELVRMLRSYNGYLEPFKQAGDRYAQFTREQRNAEDSGGRPGPSGG